MGPFVKQTLNKRKKIFRSDERLKEALLDLKETTERAMNTPNLKLMGGIYREMAEAELFTVTLNNLEVGYRIIRKPEKELTETRKVFVHLHGFRFDELTDEEKDPIMGAVFDTFLSKQANLPDVEAPDASTVVFIQECVRPGALAGEVIQ